MDIAQVLDLARSAIVVVLQLTAPILVLTLVVGVLVSLFQAVTQIQEQTLSFVPKIVIMIGCIVVLGPWMLQSVVGFTTRMFSSLPTVIH
ncbi:flagellar biosynthetic protein FliQ [Capsulimonas corticalis]|uniref:Flagellar biosynthetic protein FliQ n=1 Tax=Capsulimonas corticalis TaxID=2219043 RepID=A0A402CXG0_9BACT|nr:flagellar biosynthesis protein FliQ [Capsulimonas corticalis]BDI32298.1 flagellar biosynthetic protein FliQ [Capsulimonas corticalis]